MASVNEQIDQIIKERYDRLEQLMRTDDYVRPLEDDEICYRMHRVGGHQTCITCGKQYIDHPYETRVLYEGAPYLHRLCNGWLGKL